MLGLGEGQERCFTRTEFGVRRMKVLGVDGGECTSMPTYLMTETMNFMLNVFYHNFKIHTRVF